MSAVLFLRYQRETIRDVRFIVGGNSFQSTYGDRLFFYSSAPACRFAGAVAGTSKDAGKHIRLPVDHIGIGIALLGDQTYVFGDRGVGGTGPLAVDYFMKVFGIGDISRFHC
jgi:hypothetical protein